jgi:hypothetical protein
LSQAHKHAAGCTMPQAVKSPASYRGEPVLIHVVLVAKSGSRTDFFLVLWVSSVIIVLPVLHINPCRHHRRYIIQAIDNVYKCRMQLHAHMQTHTE